MSAAAVDPVSARASADAALMLERIENAEHQHATLGHAGDAVFVLEAKVGRALLAELAKLELLLRRQALAGAEDTLAAARWRAVRTDVTLFYRHYTRDERHDRDLRRGSELDVGQLADDAADLVRIKVAS